MNIEKPQVIAAGFILFGCFLCMFGIYLSFDSKAEGHSVPQYISTTNYNTNSEIITSNTAVKRANNPPVRSKEESVTAKKKSAPPPAETKRVVQSKPVVKETPPFPAPSGARWQRVKNGWILSPIEQPKKLAKTNSNP